MKRRFLIGLMTICSLCIGFAACDGAKNEAKENRYVIDGVTDIALSVEQTECDFLKGIVGWAGETLKDVEVDASSVQFGKVGEYEITYSLEDVTQTATVRIYGAPEILGEERYETHYEANLDAFAGLVGKDSFGAELEITTNHEFERDAFGRILYGDHFFRYYVTDAAGNTSYFDRTYTVKAPVGYEFSDVVITEGKPEATINIEGKVLQNVIYNGEIVPAGLYNVEDDVLDMTKLAIELGKGQHVCELSFEGGYANVVLDMQITAQQYYARPIVGEEMVKIFCVYEGGAAANNHVVWDEQEQAFHFVNNVKAEDDRRGFYIDPEFFNALIKKGKVQSMTFEMKFEVQDNSNVQFYQGFIPEWWDNSWTKMQLKGFKEGYQTVSVDFAKADMVGDQYKTLFMLATIGGFYIKNIQLQHEVVYAPTKVYDADGTNSSLQPISLSEANSISKGFYSVVDSTAENVPSGIEGSAFKINAAAIPLYSGNTISVAEDVTVDAQDALISIRLYIKASGNTTAEWFLYNPTCADKAGVALLDDIKGIKTNEWVEIRVRAKDYLVDGKFVGFQFINCTPNLSEIYVDSVSILNVVKGE